MPYLICNNCNVSYEIKDISEMDDFHTCTCGNELKFYETVEEYMYEGLDAQNESEEDTKGAFYSINKKNLVLMEMNMLKEHEETEKRERELRDLKYRIRHAIKGNKEESEDSEEYVPIIAKEFGDKSLKKRKELLLKEMELLKESKKEDIWSYYFTLILVLF